VAVRLLADAPEDLSDVADVDRGRDRNVDDGSRPVPRQVGDLNDLAVRCGDDLAANRAEACDPERDVLDGPGDRLLHARGPDRNDVAEAVLPLPRDEEPGADVLDKSLQAETQGGAEQGGRRDQAA